MCKFCISILYLATSLNLLLMLVTIQYINIFDVLVHDLLFAFSLLLFEFIIAPLGVPQVYSELSAFKWPDSKHCELCYVFLL